jgi:predicted 3-demethylubiquinone-9 3-methyltransferase (glyoxalase superfamily)
MSDKLFPCLWFDGNAEEAMRFYASVFPSVKFLDEMRYTEAGPGPAGSLLAVTVEIEGQRFVALNGGPQFKFTPAVSFLVNCDSQEEIDRLWGRLCEGGTPIQCGWVTDRYGLSWQIVPRALSRMLMDRDAGRAARVARAMFKMIKLDIATLTRAYAGA